MCRGLDMYSHAWILFTFHANTDAHTKQQTAMQQSTNSKSKQSKNKGNSTNNNGMLNLSKTKIRPPRAPHGLKVGMLATQSPQTEQYWIKFSTNYISRQKE